LPFAKAAGPSAPAWLLKSKNSMSPFSTWEVWRDEDEGNVDNRHVESARTQFGTSEVILGIDPEPMLGRNPDGSPKLPSAVGMVRTKNGTEAVVVAQTEGLIKETAMLMGGVVVEPEILKNLPPHIEPSGEIE